MKYFKHKIFSSVLLTMFSTIFTLGQGDKAKINGLSVNTNIGFYAGPGSGGIAGGYDLNIQVNKITYSVSYIKCEELNLFGPDPSEYFHHTGILLGKYRGDDTFRFQYQGGLGAFWGLKRTDLIEEDSGLFSSEDYESEEFFTVGFIGKVGFRIVPVRFVGFGLDLHANLNIEKPVIMPMISLEIGVLKPKDK